MLSRLAFPLVGLTLIHVKLFLEDPVGCFPWDAGKRPCKWHKVANRLLLDWNSLKFSSYLNPYCARTLEYPLLCLGTRKSNSPHWGGGNYAEVKYCTVGSFSNSCRFFHLHETSKIYQRRQQNHNTHFNSWVHFVSKCPLVVRKNYLGCS